MDKNSIMPSMENIISAAEDNLEPESNNDISTDTIFDAKKWYLQSYPDKNVKVDNYTHLHKDDDKQKQTIKPKHKNIFARIIAAIIAAALIILSIIFVPYYLETHFIASLDNYIGENQCTYDMTAEELFNNIKSKGYTTRDVINRYGNPDHSNIWVFEGGVMRYDTDNGQDSILIYFDYFGNITDVYI